MNIRRRGQLTPDKRGNHFFPATCRPPRKMLKTLHKKKNSTHSCCQGKDCDELAIFQCVSSYFFFLLRPEINSHWNISNLNLQYQIKLFKLRKEADYPITGVLFRLDEIENLLFSGQNLSSDWTYHSSTHIYHLVFISTCDICRGTVSSTSFPSSYILHLSVSSCL